MKNTILITCSFLLVFTSCEDTIDVDLDQNVDQLVVDAWINNNPEKQVIRLTTTAPYFKDSFTPVVTGATVIVTDDAGDTFSFLDNDNDGTYEWIPAIGQTLGQIGTKLRLTISSEGETYTATSQIHRVPSIDSISVRFRDDMLGEPDGIYAELFAKDFVGEDDVYWIKSFKNGEYLNKPDELNIAYDAAFTAGTVDGVTFIRPIREFVNPTTEDDESPYVFGDSIRIEIHSLNLDAFFFLEQVFTQTTIGDNGIFAEPPSNVSTNIENLDLNSKKLPLGFFNVALVSSEEVVVQ